MENDRIFICKRKGNKCINACYIYSESKKNEKLGVTSLLICNLPAKARGKKCKVKILELVKQL